MKRVLVNLALVLSSIVLTLAAVEVFLRVVDWKPYFEIGAPSYMMGTEIFFDDKFGFRFRPHSRKDINNYGFRDNDFSIEKTGKKRIAFIGDSFIMASNVEFDSSIPRRLQTKLGEGYEVYNMGIQGYGPDQSLAALNEVALQFKPDMVILGIFPSNDFNDIAKNELYVQGPSGAIVRNDMNPVTRRLPRLRTEYLLSYIIVKKIPSSRSPVVQHYKKRYDDLFLGFFDDTYDYDFERNPDSENTRYKIEVFKGVLKQMAAVCKDNDIPFFAVIIPYDRKIRGLSALDESYLSIWNDEKIFFIENTAEDICTQLSVDCIQLHKAFRSGMAREQLAALYDPNDAHFSVYGNTVVAEIVRDHIMQNYPEMAAP